MDDLISRQTAIEELRRMMIALYGYDATSVISCAIYKLQNLPSAEPEHSQNTPQKQPDLETFGVKTGETCADTISRQEVIEIFTQLWDCVGEIADRDEWEDVCKTTANELPSVQPEIIRCKECKYWFDIDDGRQKHRMCADFFGEWFCADAERRTDERSD